MIKVTMTLMLTHIVHHICWTARPMNFKLGIWMENDDQHQPQAPWPGPRRLRLITWPCDLDLWVKVARSRDHSQPSWPQCCTYVIRDRWGHTVSAERGGHTCCYLLQYSCTNNNV